MLLNISLLHSKVSRWRAWNKCFLCSSVTALTEKAKCASTNTSDCQRNSRSLRVIDFFTWVTWWSWKQRLIESAVGLRALSQRQPLCCTNVGFLIQFCESTTGCREQNLVWDLLCIAKYHPEPHSNGQYWCTCKLGMHRLWNFGLIHRLRCNPDDLLAFVYSLFSGVTFQNRPSSTQVTDLPESLFPGKRHLFVLDLLPVTVATCSYSHRYFLWSKTCLQVVNTHKHTHTALCDALSQIHYSAECCEGRPWPLWSSSLGSFHTLAWYKSNGNTMSVGYSRCEHVWWWITGHSRLRGRLLARTPIFLASSMKLFCLSFPVFLPWRSDINI